MNAFESTWAVTIIGVVLGTSTAAADDKVMIDTDGKSASFECAGQEVVIRASRAQVTLTGSCGEVDVKGSENAIRIESAGKIEIWGSRNSIDVAATNKIQAAGDDNRTQYVRGLGKKAPVKKSWGKRNVFKRVNELPDATTADAPTTRDTPGGGGASKPGGATAAPREQQPVRCQRNDSVTLDGVIIRTAGVAISTEGNCRLTITNSKIISTGGSAIATAGSSVVTLEAVEVEGVHGAVMNAGSAMVTIRRATLRGTLGVQGSSTVRLENSTVHGDRSVTSSAIYVDGGGNKFVKR